MGGDSKVSDRLLGLAQNHACWKHPLFDAVKEVELDSQKLGRLLRNYDAHASALRRLLLKAATIMPEAAVGYVLENVRNEYGNGDYRNNHQAQLRDVAARAGVDERTWRGAKIQPGVRAFIKAATRYYYPLKQKVGSETHKRAAIAAGAITATELLAIKEFQYLQMACTKLGLENHIWFDHVTTEAEHGDESIALAVFFDEHYDAFESVRQGMEGILDANLSLYDGLLAAIDD